MDRNTEEVERPGCVGGLSVRVVEGCFGISGVSLGVVFVFLQLVHDEYGPDDFLYPELHAARGTDLLHQLGRVVGDTPRLAHPRVLL